MEHSDDNEETQTEYFSTTEYSGGEMYVSTTAPPPEPKEPAVRPVLISVLAVLGYIACIIQIVVGGIGILSAEIVTWPILYMLVGGSCGLLGYIGIWKMQLWGLYVLVLLFLVNVVVTLSTNGGSSLSLTGSAVVLAILALNSKKME